MVRTECMTPPERGGSCRSVTVTTAEGVGINLLAAVAAPLVFRINRLIAQSAIVLGVVSFSTPALAYLDAGTGSMILQLLIGGFAGAMVVGKLYWQKIKNLFGRGSAGAKRDGSPDNR